MNISLLIKNCTYKFKHNTSSFFIVVALFAYSLSAAAQVVVIPLGGDEDSSAVWAQNDGNSGGNIYTTETGLIEINSISINVPKDGFLVISGSTFINNNNNIKSNFKLRPFIDGVATAASDFFASGRLAEDAGIDTMTLSYTITAPIGKGSHTISQAIQNDSGGGTYFTNGETLSAMFYPAGSITQKNSGPTAIAGSQLKTLGNSSTADGSGDITD